MSEKINALVFSNAFNFDDFLSGGVDPRTGLYTFNLSLGNIHSSTLNGPSFNINLQFSPLDTLDTGLGAGWSIPLSRYDVLNNTLSLSSGDSYKATPVAGGLKFAEPYVENFKISSSTEGHYSVFHKNGLREVLEVFESTDYAVPRRIEAANGAHILLDYTLHQGKPVLVKVRSVERTLLSIIYDDAQVILTQYPGTDSEARFTLALGNDRVSSIALPTGDRWLFTYEEVQGFVCLTQVDSAMGAREQIQYGSSGHAFPPGGPVASLPYVIAHTLLPGVDQPAIVTEYEYSENNFLGFNGGLSWSAELDSLSAAPDDYCYTSTETLIRGAAAWRTKVRTYNKYHLLLSEVTRCGQATHSVATQYHLLPGKSLDDQPPQFRLPLTQTQQYKSEGTGKQRTEVTRTEFDEYGNLLKQVEPSGITTISDFYAATGGQGCPADPLGFVRFEKQRVVHPAEGMAGAPVTVSRYRYQLLKGLTGSSMQHVVPVTEQLSERTAAGESLRLQTDLSYYDLPGEPHRHGLLKKQTRVQQGHSTHGEFSYTLRGAQLIVQTTLTGFDGVQTTDSRTYSALNGALLSGTNQDGVTTDFVYDAIGRPLSETVAPGTTFEAQRHSICTAATSGSPATLLNTDASGMKQRVTYDGIGRVVSIEEQDSDQSKDGPLRVVYVARYDETDQLVDEVRTDWLDGVALPLKQTFVFDDWGNIRTSVFQSGRQQHEDHDPVSRQVSRWTEGAGKTVTLFNAFDKPLSVEAFDRKGKSLGKTTHRYDGLGRAVGQTGPEGKTTTHAYDVFGRLQRSVLPDGSVVETAYAAHSHLSLPIEVKVGARSLGRQTFDGLSRLTRSEVGGRQSSLQYEGGSKRPSVESKPGGERVRYSYEPNLGGKVVQRQALEAQMGALSEPALVADYSYESRLGGLTSCSEQGRESRFEYSRSGKLKREASTQPGQTTTTAEYSYSMAGRPLAYTDVLGAQHKTTYDDLGRPKSHVQNQVKADFSYNALEQLETIHTQDIVSGRSLVTRLAYDDLGREVTRRFEADKDVSQTLISRYTLASKLAQRTLKNRDQVVRDEWFSYDARGRLNDYRCDGMQRPRDFRGNEIIRQKFVFDELDNILTLETEFSGGKNLATYEYSQVDPTQLISIRHSHGDYPQPVTLQYDANGQLVRDEQGRTLTYDALGRLTQVATSQGVVLRGYGYDAMDNLVQLSSPEVVPTQRYYRDGRMMNDVCGGDATSCLRQDGLLLARHHSGKNAGVRLSGTDQQQTVLGEITGSGHSEIAYSPYGYCQGQEEPFNPAGFNGEPFDSLTGLYLLGNGYRAYSPALMRFHSPDSMSPFGRGGLNPYAYCLGDPINRVDPTGHFSWQSILGIALSIVGVVASFATFGAATPLAILGLGLGGVSALAGIAGTVAGELLPGSVAGEVLGWMSFATGVGSIAAGSLAASKAFTQWGSRLLTSPPARVTKFGYRPGALAGGGRGAKGARSVGRSSQTPSTSAQSARPEKWTVIDDIGRNDLTPNGRPGNVARSKYADFKRGVEEGLSPHESARAHLGNSYDPYPGYSSYTRLVSDVKASNQVAVNAARKAGEVPALISEPQHIHARLGGFDRVFFLEYRAEMKVVIKQIGDHDPQW
ncbi:MULTISPECIES: RHS repeat-associated core domain-containing protein [unclassified Pseudomonas]|uniref:RHS repeat-associated core domain-containing protein n=1 Tax=Pseudomonas sp. MYb327 TaxID=2745230 RepID=A0AAU8E082_9PSED